MFWRNSEPEKHIAYKNLIKSGDIIFDIGANVGLHSYFFSREFSNVKIIAFEPLPNNIFYIKETIKRNNINNVQLIESALGSEVKFTYFNTSYGNSTGFITTAQTNLKVSVDTLDNFIKSNLIRPHFIKIDVEGAEWEVLEGFKSSIKSILPIMIIELHTPSNDKKVAQFFKELPYTILRLGNLKNCKVGKPFSNIKNLESTWPDPNGVWGNLVVIPNSKIDVYKELID